MPTFNWRALANNWRTWTQEGDGKLLSRPTVSIINAVANPFRRVYTAIWEDGTDDNGYVKQHNLAYRAGRFFLRCLATAVLSIAAGVVIGPVALATITVDATINGVGKGLVNIAGGVKDTVIGLVRDDSDKTKNGLARILIGFRNLFIGAATITAAIVVPVVAAPSVPIVAVLAPFVAARIAVDNAAERVGESSGSEYENIFSPPVERSLDHLPHLPPSDDYSSDHAPDHDNRNHYTIRAEQDMAELAHLNALYHSHGNAPVEVQSEDPVPAAEPVILSQTSSRKRRSSSTKDVSDKDLRDVPLTPAQAIQPEPDNTDKGHKRHKKGGSPKAAG